MEADKLFSLHLLSFQQWIEVHRPPEAAQEFSPFFVFPIQIDPSLCPI